MLKWKKKKKQKQYIYNKCKHLHTEIKTHTIIIKFILSHRVFFFLFVSQIMVCCVSVTQCICVVLLTGNASLVALIDAHVPTYTHISYTCRNDCPSLNCFQSPKISAQFLGAFGIFTCFTITYNIRKCIDRQMKTFMLVSCEPWIVRQVIVI